MLIGLVLLAAILRAAEPPLPVRLSIEPEAGSSHGLVFRIENRGSEALTIVAHRGLLALELRSEERRRSRPLACKAPAGFTPREVDPSQIALLAPGSSYSERVDLRYFCWDRRAAALLGQPGLRVRARYGFRRATERTWMARDDHARLLASVSSDEIAMPTPGAPAAAAAEPLRLEVGPARVGTTDGAHVAVSARLSNAGDIPLRVWVHPDLFRFDVDGPGVDVRCGLPRVARSPLRQSFVLLRPRRRSVLALDVRDYCPRGTFDRSGVYDVTPVFEATEGGAPLGLGAFTGVVEGAAIAVRVGVGKRVAYEPDLPGEVR